MDMIGNRNLRDLLEERVELYGDRQIFVFESVNGVQQEFTYREFDRVVNRLANGLLKAGIESGHNIVVHLSNCPAFVITWFALAKIGAVMVPTNTANTASELRYILEFSDAAAIVTSPMLLDTVRTARVGNSRLSRLYLTQIAEDEADFMAWNDLWRDQPDVLTPTRISSDHPAQILFTSGTTADPKGAVLTHANCLFAGEQTARMFRLAPGERCITALPCFHCNAQSFGILAPLTSGATSILLESFSATRYWKQVRDHKANVVTMLPTLLRTVLAQPKDPDDSNHDIRVVNYAINCTDGEKAAFEKHFGVELMNGYGLTEAMTIVTSAPIDGKRKWPSIGLPAIGREVKIVDAAGNDAAVGEVGQIVCKGVPGRSIFKGYYRDPKATDAAIIDGWLQTGDAGWMDEAGYFYFFERIKEVIKRGGENVSTSEVEGVLLGHPSVAECAVIGIPDPIKDEAIEAHVVLHPGLSSSESDLIGYCSTRLAKFKVPQSIKFHASLPKTSIGKIAKKHLRKRET